MSDLLAIDLLREALDLLRQPLSHDPGDRVRHALAARIGRFLSHREYRAAEKDLLNDVRTRWKDEPGIRVDDAATLASDAQGLWASGWLLVGAVREPIDPDAYHAALADLPVLTREVFLLNRRDGHDYGAIADRLGLTASEVEQEISAALAGLHRHIHRGRP